METTEDNQAECRFCRYNDAIGGIEDILFNEIKEWLEEEKERELSDYEKELCEEEASKLAETIMQESVAISMRQIEEKVFQ